MIKFTIFLCIITSMIGSIGVLDINLGVFYLHPFRLCFIFLLFLMIINVFKVINNINYITIRNRRNNFYSIKFMFIWFVYTVLSLIWVNDYSGWLLSARHIFIGLILCILFSQHLKDNLDFLFAFRMILIMIIIHNIIGWYEIFTSNYMFLPFERIETYSLLRLPVSTFFNVNDFATFMLFAVCVSFICFYNANSKKMKYISLITMLSSAMLIIVSDSRANILGLIILLVTFVYFTLGPQELFRLIKVLIVVGIIMIFYNTEIIIKFVGLIDKVINFSLPSSVIVSSSEDTRINLIRNGFSFLLSTSGFGVGAGNFEYWVENRGLYDTNGVLNMHNWWMEILTCYGILIFALYIVFYIKLVISYTNKFRYSNCKIEKSISLGILCFIISFIIASISSSTNITKLWLWVFWGMAVSYQGIDNRPEYIKS